MSWSIRLKLNMLPILDSNGIDAVILSRDIYARLGLPREWSDKLKIKKATKVFYSAASAEGYIDEMKGGDVLEIFTWRQGYAWKRIGHCLVFLYAPVPLVLPPIPSKCIVRTAESIWELYDLGKVTSE